MVTEHITSPNELMQKAWMWQNIRANGEWVFSAELDGTAQACLLAGV